LDIDHNDHVPWIVQHVAATKDILQASSFSHFAPTCRPKSTSSRSSSSSPGSKNAAPLENHHHHHHHNCPGWALSFLFQIFTSNTSSIKLIEDDDADQASGNLRLQWDFMKSFKSLQVISTNLICFAFLLLSWVHHSSHRSTN
jgi:hypothetical protein